MSFQMVPNTAAGGTNVVVTAEFMPPAAVFFNYLETMVELRWWSGTGCGADDRTIWNALYFSTGRTLLPHTS